MKKAQGASAAATLVGILILLLVFYILFLPPAEREKLLETETGAPGTAVSENVLAQGPVGKISYLGTSTMEHSIPSIALIETKNAQVLTTISPFVIKKTLVSKQYKTITFALSSPENIDNALLSFAVPKREGVLKIILNTYPIFEGRITTLNPPPVSIPKAYLRTENTLEFEVYDSGLGTAEYNFEDIKLIGDVTDASKMVATTDFVLAEQEFANLEGATLKFTPECIQAAVGPLEILLNNKKIFSAVPDCRTLNRLELSKTDFVSGKNTLFFRTHKGNYRLDTMEVETRLKKTEAFTTYFNIDSTTYNDILYRKRTVELRIEFVDDGKRKSADITINGRPYSLDQREAKYIQDITPAVQQGKNYIMFKPESDMEIVKFEIRAD